MEQDRAGKGQAPAAGAALAVVDSEKGQRQEPLKCKAEAVAGVATVLAAAAKTEAVEQKTRIEKGRTTMPAGNGMGPQGMGPMTGRGMGFCAGAAVPGFITVPGRGFGMGCGRGFRGRGVGGGRGWRNMFNATGLTGWQRAAAGWPMAGGVPPYAAAPTREQQLEALKDQAEYFESALGDIRKQIEELGAGKTGK